MTPVKQMGRPRRPAPVVRNYTDAMPLYEFRCRTCDTNFEVRRPMAEASEPAVCPQGHPGAV